MTNATYAIETRNAALAAIADKIKTARDLWDLHEALCIFETVYDATDDDRNTEGSLLHFGIDITELPEFGGDEPRSTDGVWSWDEDNLLVGEGPFSTWSIVDREEYTAAA